MDPSNGLDGMMDIAIKDGHISTVSRAIDPDDAKEVYDAQGQLVTPGLVDLHAHGYHLATPLGINIDHYSLGRGVTTVVDAGSAGCSTFPGFRSFAVERFSTRMLAFLNISCCGLSFATISGNQTLGELESIKLLDTQGCIDCVNENRDVLVGVKVRLSDDLADNGQNEAEAYLRALQAAKEVALPLMVHHTFSTVPLEDCPGKMSEGDIYTHCFHGFRSTIIDRTSRKINPVVRHARDRGVRFDIGHGMGAFSWTVAEICAAEGFWPDVISTDLHSMTADGPAYDMPTVMTRLLHVGMPMKSVIEASTSTPAKSIGWDDRIGSLGVGREADVTVLEHQEVAIDLEDCQSQMRRINQRLVAKAVWRAGKKCVITHPQHWPNPETIEKCRPLQQRLEIKDLA